VFLTGPNHHQNGFASISETSTGFPGYNSHIPRENAAMATVLRNAGWSTFWVGKNHNTPVDGPEDGYHLSKDLADKALEFIRDAKQSEPDKPWYLWFCPGANHAPTTPPRTTSTGTGASSTTAMRPTASGCCRGWSSAGSCPRAPS